MSNKFLTTSTVSDLSKTNLTCASLSASNLNPSHTLKTDSNRRIVSSTLSIGDVTGLLTILNSTITTPFEGTIVASNFETGQTNLNALSSNVSNNTTNIVSNTTTISANTTTISAINVDISTLQPNVTTNTANIAVLLANQGLSQTGGKYNQTGPDISVLNTDQLTSILNSGVGSLVFNANELQAGASYRIHCSGRILTEGKQEAIDFRLFVGSANMSTDPMPLDHVRQIIPWKLEIDIVVRSTGANAELNYTSLFTYAKDGGADDFRGIVRDGNLTINSTTSNTFTAAVKWNNAEIDNKLFVSQLRITKTF
jgi:hypothetical protein